MDKADEDDIIVVGGDFNAQVGVQDKNIDDKVCGRYGIRRQTKNGRVTHAKTGDRRRQSKTSMTQQNMYLHLYEFLAAPPSVVRLQYWRGYRDRSVEKSREQYTSVISR